MGSNRRHLKRCRELLEDLGLVVLEVRHRKHDVYKVQHASGRPFMVSFPQSPSDGRWLENKRSQLRALIRENTHAKAEERDRARAQAQAPAAEAGPVKGRGVRVPKTR